MTAAMLDLHLPPLPLSPRNNCGMTWDMYLKRVQAKPPNNRKKYKAPMMQSGSLLQHFQTQWFQSSPLKVLGWRTRKRMQGCSKQCHWELEKTVLEPVRWVSRWLNCKRVWHQVWSLSPIWWQGISDSHKLFFNLHMHICLHTYTHRWT